MKDLVSIVLIPDTWGEGLARSLASAQAQTYEPIEIIVAAGVDDARATIVLPGLQIIGGPVRVAEAPLPTPGSARNAGLRAAAGAFLVCLDEGDLLEPGFCADAMRALAADDSLGFVMAPSVNHPGGEPISPELPAAWDARAALGTTWSAPMALILRRTAWEAAGGFDETLDALEQYDFLLRMGRAGGRGVVLDRPGIRHTSHRDSRHRRSLAAEAYGAALRAAMERHRPAFEVDPAAVLFDRELTLRELVRLHRLRVARRDERFEALRRATDEAGRIRTFLRDEGRDAFEWGDFQRTSPVSRNWGYDRGKPIDRYYIDQFIERHAPDVRGAVLEVQEDDLTVRVGGARVTRSEVIDINPANARATIIGDLRHAPAIAGDTFDCIILTQTLHVIDDMRRVLAECHRILKPGGVLLVTLPSASRVCLEYGRDGDFWRVTEAGARALFADVFEPADVQTRAFGNVQVNVAFLQGLACHEVAQEVFEAHDPYFPLIIGVRATKRAASAIDATGPPRSGARRAASLVSGAILMYHRIAVPSDSDVHGLCVRPDDFTRQMEALRRDFHPMPLADLVEAARRGALPARAVAVTFDDGYLDALTTAGPILEASGIPATFFVTTDRIDAGREFWWDRLERILLGAGDRPPSLALRSLSAAHAFATRTPEDRRATHWAIYARLQDATPDLQDAVLRELDAWSGPTLVPAVGARPMTVAELTTLARHPAFAIGAHGARHLRLPVQPEDRQRADVEECRAVLERTLTRPITAFAYPFGDWSAATARIVRESGFSMAVTCEDAPARPGGDPWRLPRFEVRPDLGAHLARRLLAFLSRE